MQRIKWIKWGLVEGLTGFVIVFFYYKHILPESVLKALIFFYTGFTVSTILLIGFLFYSTRTKEATRKAGRVWGGFLIKFLAALILIVVYLYKGGFQQAEEGMAVIMMYLLFSWLGYSLAAED